SSADQTDVQLTLDRFVGGEPMVQETRTATSQKQAGYVIDTTQGPQQNSIGPPWLHGNQGGYELNWVKENGQPRNDASLLSDFTFSVGTDTVTVTGWAMADWQGHGRDFKTLPTSLELSAKVFLKKSVPTFTESDDGL